jgi:hypothetical protein
MLKPGLIIPIVLIVAGVPAALVWYRRWRTADFESDAQRRLAAVASGV